ncbi:MAG: hypothetical protein ACPGXY_00960 [Alphaproteobacteria bacterium]
MTDGTKAFLQSWTPVGLLITLSWIQISFPAFPDLFYISLFVLALYRSELVHPVLLLIIGVFADIVLGNPLGFMAIIYLSFFGIVSFFRRYVREHTFFITWIVFSCLYLVLQNTINWLSATETIIPLSVIATIVVYPAWAALLIKIEPILFDAVHHGSP